MYNLVKSLLLSLLKVSPEPPQPPPGGRTVRTFRAAPKFLHYRLLGLYIGGPFFLFVEVAPALAAVLAAKSTVGAVVLFIAVAMTIAAMLLTYFTNRLEYDLRYYILTDRSLRIREGAVIVRESTLTFANVQNISIRQGPLQQLFGIADVIVDTAGGGSRLKEANGQMESQHRGVIRGVANAPEIRDQVLALLKQYRDAGLGDPGDPSTEPGGTAPERLQEILAEVRGLRTAVTRPG